MPRYRQNERRYKGVSQRGWYRGFINIEFSRPRMKRKCFFWDFLCSVCWLTWQTVNQIV